MATCSRARVFASWPKKPDNLKFDTGRQNETGRGSYGTVYKGEFDGRPVAVKILHSTLLEDRRNDRILREFEKESSILKALDHSNIVKLLGTFWDDEEGGRPLLVMEYHEENLKEYLARNKGKLSLGRQLEIAQEVTEGLRFLHEQNIVHRDLTLKNILVGADGHVRIGDFGQSKLLSDLREDMETTQPGTVAYMPPEALTHDSTYNATIDVFSLGVVFVCIATQREPTVGMSEIGSRPELKRRARDLQPLSRGHPLEFFINRCLQDNCENRPDVFMIHHVLNPLIQGIHLPDIQSRLEMTEKRKESLEEKVKKTEQKLDMEQKAFQEKVKKTEEQLYKEQTAFKAERDKLSVLEKKYTTLQAERDKLMLKTMNMEKKCDSLQDSLKQTCEENRAFQLKTRRVNEFLQDEREKLRNMEEMCVSLKNQLKVKTVREEDLMKELATTKGKLTETQDQLKTHQQKQKVTMQNLQELLEEQAQIQQEQVKVWQSQIQEQANVEKNFHSRMMKCLQDDRKSSN